MLILTEKAIEGYKQDTEKKIARARYKIGDEYFDAPIHRRERLPDGRVAVYFSITPAAAGSVTRDASRCKVTITHNGKHPYHLISEDGKGVYGRVDSANVTK